MRISDWSSDVCSSDLERTVILTHAEEGGKTIGRFGASVAPPGDLWHELRAVSRFGPLAAIPHAVSESWRMSSLMLRMPARMVTGEGTVKNVRTPWQCSEEASGGNEGGMTVSDRGVQVQVNK